MGRSKDDNACHNAPSRDEAPAEQAKSSRATRPQLLSGHSRQAPIPRRRKGCQVRGQTTMGSPALRRLWKVLSTCVRCRQLGCSCFHIHGWSVDSRDELAAVGPHTAAQWPCSHVRGARGCFLCRWSIQLRSHFYAQRVRNSCRAIHGACGRCRRDARGCRLAFDLGKSDIKTVAVQDNKVLSSKETEWDVTNPDPQYHYDAIIAAMKETAAVLPRIDAIGGSATGT